MQKLLLQTQIRSDQLVQSMADLIVMVFQDRILSIYLGGSYSRDQLTVTSDIDLTVVFRNSVSAEETERFMALRETLQTLSPLRLDLWPIAEDKIKARPASAAIRSSYCLYGEHFLHTVPAQSVEAFAMKSVHKSIHYMTVLRGRPRQNPFPLAYPDEEDVFYGYTQCGDFAEAQTFQPGVRIILNMLYDRRIAVGATRESVQRLLPTILRDVKRRVR